MTPAPVGERVRALEIRADDCDAENLSVHSRVSELRAEIYTELAKVHICIADHERDIKTQFKFQNFLTGAAAGVSFIVGALASLFGPLKDVLHR